jgi:hypothetical protein
MLKGFCSCSQEGDEVNNFSFERAPEPTDLYWENMSVSSGQRFFRVILTYLSTLVLVGVCFGIIYGLNIAKISLKSREEQEGNG